MQSNNRGLALPLFFTDACHYSETYNYRLRDNNMTQRSPLGVQFTGFFIACGLSWALLIHYSNQPIHLALFGIIVVWLLYSIISFTLVRRIFQTKVRELAQQNQDSSRYEKAILEASLDSLITIDDQGIVTSFSDSAVSMFHYPAEEALGANIADLIIPEEYREGHIRGMAHFNATGEGPVLNQRIEIQALRKNGETFPCELTVIPIRLEGATNFTAFVRDISSQKESQTAIEQAKQQAEAANKAKTRFLTTMSHEMRSPLTSIIGALELLAPNVENAQQRNWISTARRSCNTMLSLVNDVLDMSRIETGSLELNPVMFEPMSMLYSITEIAHIKANDKGLALCPLVHSPLPDTLVGDETRIRQILVNLVDNAIKFTEQGAVVLHLNYHENQAGRGRLIFRVIDTGIGIPDHAQQQLFDEFFQVDNSNTTPFDGTGLGLSIVKELIDIMGGDIQLHSREQKGSEFVVELPLARPPDAKLLSLDLKAELIVIAQPGYYRDALLEQLTLLSINAQCKSPQELPSQSNKISADYILVEDTLLSQIPESIRTSKQCVSFSFQHSTEHLYPFSIDAIQRLLSNDPDDHKDHNIASFNQELASERANKQLLLAEDNDANRLVLLAMIEQSGYRVITALNGAEAITKAQSNDIDLILMDMRMPKLDGVSATQQLRQDGFQNPIIAMTANAMPADISACIDSGMNDFVTKPVRAPVLIEVIDRWLNIGSEADAENGENHTMSPPRPAGSGISLLDENVLSGLADDVGAETLPEIIALFIGELEQAREQLASAGLGPEDWRDIAHKTKSSAGFYGAIRLYEYAHELEERSKTAPGQDLSALVNDFDQCLKDTIDRYRQPNE